MIDGGCIDGYYDGNTDGHMGRVEQGEHVRCAERNTCDLTQSHAINTSNLPSYLTRAQTKFFLISTVMPTSMEENK